MKTLTRNAFTLVELLAVLAIIGLMVAVSIPAMHRITQATALSAGTRQFSDHVAAARTYALVNGKDVYVLLPYSATVNTTISNTYCYVSYGFAVSAVSSWSQGVDPLSRVDYVDAIQYLPPGVVFGDQINNISTYTVAFPNSNSPPVSVRYFKINRYGQIAPLTSPPTVRMLQGYISATSPFVPMPGPAGTNVIALNTLTGKALVTKF